MRGVDVFPFPFVDCPEEFDLPVRELIEISIPKHLMPQTLFRAGSVYHWFSLGCPDDKGVPQIQPVTNRCLQRIGFMQFFSLDLYEAKEIIPVYRSRLGVYSKPSRDRILLTNLFEPVEIEEIEDELPEEELPPVPLRNYAGLIRWSWAESRLKDEEGKRKYTDSYELIVYCNLAEDIPDDEREEIFTRLLECVLKDIGYPDLEKVLNDWVHPSEVRSKKFKAKVEVVEISKYMKDGIYEYLKWDANTFDEVTDGLPVTNDKQLEELDKVVRKEIKTGVIDTGECLEGIWHD